MDYLLNLKNNDVPVIATAIHDGHQLSEEALKLMALSSEDRLREEDPFTGAWTGVVENSLIVKTSRFEVDLNRARDKAVYLTPDDAWGLNVWESKPGEKFVRSSLQTYDLFYKNIHDVLSEFESKFGKFVVFDVHSYNHRRNGPDAQPAAGKDNPEVNIGTGTMLDRSRWKGVINNFIDDLSSFNYFGRKLDVRENIKFRGGHFPEFVHEKFPDAACVLSIEFKKIFMNEWTGEPDKEKIQTIFQALQSAVPGVLEELNKI